MPSPDGDPVAWPDFQTALNFIEIKDRAADGDPAWWPCVVFPNMRKLTKATTQLNLCHSFHWMRDIIQTYMQTHPTSPNTDTAVALLLGENTPNNKRCVFLTRDGPKVEPLVGEKAVELYMTYKHHASFRQTMEVAEQLLNGNAATNEASTTNANDGQNQSDTNPLKFIEIKDGGPAWWPCMVFRNVLELTSDTKQLNLSQSKREKAQWTADFLAHARSHPTSPLNTDAV